MQVSPVGPLHQHSYDPPLHDGVVPLHPHVAGAWQMSFGGPLPQALIEPPHENETPASEPELPPLDDASPEDPSFRLDGPASIAPPLDEPALPEELPLPELDPPPASQIGAGSLAPPVHEQHP